MYEPSITRKSLQYSCDVCGEIPILRKRWQCEVCDDYDVCENCYQMQKERQRKKRKKKTGGSSSSTRHHRDYSSEESTEDEESMEMDEEEEGSGDVHTDAHPMRAHTVNETMEPLHSGKLPNVVKDACCRWFMDALKQAKRGDPNQAALVSQMMLEGYGCNADPKEARYWAHVARNAGARRVEGVYDELP